MWNTSVLTLSLGAILLSKVAAVIHGSEQHGNSPGHFYVFNSTTTQIVEPSNGKIVKSIAFGVPNYGDALYAEDQAQLKHYLFVAQSANNKITIFDTDEQAVLATATAGKKPVHMFSVYYRDEVLSCSLFFYAFFSSCESQYDYCQVHTPMLFALTT